MIWINIKYIFRNLWKNKLYSSINIIGIAIGFTISTLLLLYVKSHLEANKFFPNYERIYRVEKNGIRNMSKKMVQVFQDHIPEIEHITKYHGSWSQQNIIRYKNTDFQIGKPFYADSVFFKVFRFKTLYGDLQKALDRPNSIVLTKKQSEIIFGKSNPVGQNITLKTSNYGITQNTITAVIEDIPSNSSFRFDAAFSLSSLELIENYNKNADRWGTCSYSSFAMLTEGTDPKSLDKKINKAFKDYSPKWINNYSHLTINLNPIEGLQFRSKYSDGVFNVMKKPIVNILGGIGVFILLLACFNYFNLSISKTEEHIRSFGIKKVIGAGKLNLVLLSMLETGMLFSVGFVLTVIVIIYVLPVFNELTFSAFTMIDIFSSTNLFFVLTLFICSMLIFGIFPAIIISNQKIISGIKKDFEKINSYKWFKDSLIIFQFIISIILIVSTIMINKQYSFMLDSDYGFNKQNIIYCPLSPETADKSDFLEQEFEKNAMTDEVAFGSSIFGWIANNWGRSLFCNGESVDVNFDMMFVSHDFTNLFDLQVIQGEDFNENSFWKSDIIFNETFINKYNIKNPLEASLSDINDNEKVIGVVKDFNYNPMRDQINPFGMVCMKGAGGVMFVKLNTNTILETKKVLRQFEKIWDKVSPNYPFESRFMDTHFEEVYRNESQMMKILAIASILTISIACLGLFGIAYYVSTKRTKEIGIRKVNGASIVEIISLINRGFILKICIAFFIACPFTYLLIEKWLQSYAYKAQVSWWIFLLGGGCVMLTAILTVSGQCWYAARKDPVKALRYE